MSTRFRPLLTTIVGLAVFFAGLALARSWLPEWRPGLPDEEIFVQRFRELAKRAGARLERGEPLTILTAESDRSSEDARVLDRFSVDRAAALGAGMRVQAIQRATLPGIPGRWELDVTFSPAGNPLAVSWSRAKRGLFENSGAPKPAAPRARVEVFAQLLLAPRESLGASLRGGPESPASSQGLDLRIPVRQSEPPQELEVKAAQGGSISVIREISTPADNDTLAEILVIVVPVVLGVLLLTGFFFYLLSQRRIDFVNGLALAAASVLMSLAGALAAWTLEALGYALVALLGSFVLIVCWATAESFLRSVQPGFTTSLDTLRAGRLGPRGGRALVYGFGLGAILAGVRLGVSSLAAAYPGAWPGNMSLRIPPLQESSPLFQGAVLAAFVALMLALAFRFLPARWAPWMATLAGGLAVQPLRIEPLSAHVAANLALVGFLVWILRRFGLATLLAATVASFLLPAAAFTGIHVTWLPVPFGVTAGILAALVTTGWVGLGRSGQIEHQGRQGPAFIRRQEEERRLRYEMDLLARMQLGLLPEKLPEIPGWEIAARSLLATEAGGDLYDFLEDEEGSLWIAAGDVAGHGYSCSIAQAMTTAALSSLVSASQSPSGVLGRIDRVLRRNAHRHFTTLALLRLDLRTGQGRLANSGHPYPLLVKDGQVSEIALSGLPLGQGPAREYGEAAVEIPPGSALVFCSDGLFEAADWQQAIYGYERPQEVLRGLGERPAGEILEALLEDWRRHLGGLEAQDDTTVVVVRRSP